MVLVSPVSRAVLAQPQTIGALAIEQLAAQAADYAQHARAANTMKAYRSDWRDFSTWCMDAGVDALPATPFTLALYLSDLAQAGLKVATIGRRIASIAVAHKTAGYETPTTHARVKLVWAGIRRLHGTPAEGRDPILVEDLQAMLLAITLQARARVAPLRPKEPRFTQLELRDRALLLVGFAGAFRRSELVALDWSDLSVSRLGCAVRVNRSKTDQEGHGREVGLPRAAKPETCAVRALEALCVATGNPTAGPVFRAATRWGSLRASRLSAQAVALVVKRRAEAAGLDPSKLAGHSLRSGFATSAIRAGVSQLRAMETTGHRSQAVFARYVKKGELFRDNILADMGL